MTDEVEAAATAFVTASRALVGISLRSVASAPVPLTVPQHRLLVRVSADGPRRVGELAADLGVNQSNASRLVDRLAGLGLLERVRDRDDGRASLVELTVRGRRVLDAVTRRRLEELRTVVAAMSPAHRAEAVAVLHDFNRAAHEAEVEVPSPVREVAR